jgi:uncharacterized protein YgbK (DUF1537 family)
MSRLAIIADDLTSATDCGIQVARSGACTIVILGKYGIGRNVHGNSVISVDTDTRSAPSGEAYKTVKEAAEKMRANGYGEIYKSLDSTLRGNLGAEIDAVMDVYNFDFSVVAPAFPHYGRTTVKGRHYLKGVPITQTEFAVDPRTPVKEDDLVELFSCQSRRKVGLIDLYILRSGEADVSEHIAELKGHGVEIIIFDAQAEEDLDRIVQTISKIDSNVLWAGSTGLARFIPQALNLETNKFVRKEPPIFKRNAMLVSGSTSEKTRNQLNILKAQVEIVAVELRPLEIILDARRAEKEIANCKSRLLEALNNGKNAALHVPESREKVAATKLEAFKMGLDHTQIPIIISEALAKITKQVIEEFELRGLILIGGDTAKMVCKELGVVGIELLEEVELGVPLGYLVGTAPMLVVTKAGGFGSPNVLVKALRKLGGKSTLRVD